MTLTPRGGSTVMAEAENSTFETYNSNQRRGEAFYRGGALGVVTSLPGSPSEGDIYIVTSGPNADSVAEWLNGAWVYYPPFPNDLIYVDGLGQYRYDSVDGWVEIADGLGTSGTTPGLAYNWSPATTATPISGQLRGNNATYSSITSLFVHESDRNGTDVSAVLSQITDGTVIQIQSGTNPIKYAWFVVTSNTDNGSDRTISVTYLSSLGTFGDTEDVFIVFFRKGDTGPTGPTGPAGPAGSGGSGGIIPGDPVIVLGSSLVTYYTGDTDGNGIFVGDKYSQWTDQKGSNQATQSTDALRPFKGYWRGNTDLIVPCFTGNQRLALPNFITAFPNKGYIWAVVNVQICISTPGVYLAILSTSDSDHYDMSAGAFPGVYYGGQLRSTRLEGVSARVPGNGLYFLEWLSDTNLWQYYVNGVLSYSTTTQAWGPTATPYLGYIPSSNKTLYGELAEVGFCNAIPDSTQRSQLRDWVNYRWLT